MITAADALRLPIAQLTEEDRAIVDKLLREIDDGIKKAMRRNGFEFTTNNTNAVAMFEVLHILQEHGWMPQCQPMLERPRFQGAQPTHVGYTIVLVPSKEAVESAKHLLQ